MSESHIAPAGWGLIFGFIAGFIVGVCLTLLGMVVTV